MYHQMAVFVGAFAVLSGWVSQAAGQNPEAAFRSFAQSLSDVVRSAGQSEARPSQALIDVERARSMSYDNRTQRRISKSGS